MRRDSEAVFYRQVGANLKRARVYAGLSQVELGDLLGVSFQQVQKYETGTNRVPAYQLFVLHQAFNMPLDFFFEGVDEPGEADFITPHEALTRRVQAIRDAKTALKMLQLMDVFFDHPRVF